MELKISDIERCITSFHNNKEYQQRKSLHEKSLKIDIDDFPLEVIEKFALDLNNFLSLLKSKYTDDANLDNNALFHLLIIMRPFCRESNEAINTCSTYLDYFTDLKNFAITIGYIFSELKDEMLSQDLFNYVMKFDELFAINFVMPILNYLAKVNLLTLGNIDLIMTFMKESENPTLYFTTVSEQIVNLARLGLLNKEIFEKNLSLIATNNVGLSSSVIEYLSKECSLSPMDFSKLLDFCLEDPSYFVSLEIKLNEYAESGKSFDFISLHKLMKTIKATDKVELQFNSFVKFIEEINKDMNKNTITQLNDTLSNHLIESQLKNH